MNNFELESPSLMCESGFASGCRCFIIGCCYFSTHNVLVNIDSAAGGKPASVRGLTYAGAPVFWAHGLP